MAIVYTKLSIVERLRRAVANNFPTDDDSLSNTEVLLMLDQALAYAMVGMTYQGAKVEGTIAVPEGFITTYSISTLSQNSTTQEWYADLPQPPVSLPLGYSVTDVFFAKDGLGKGDPILPIESKRVAYREFMTLPSGARYWIKGKRIYLKASNGNPLNNLPLYVDMMKTRTQDINEEITAPDDIIEIAYNMVFKQLTLRYQMPQDTIKDQLPAGIKTS